MFTRSSTRRKWTPPSAPSALLSVAALTESTNKENHVRRTLAIMAVTAIATSGIALAAPAQAANTISGGGASFPYPFLSACAADFNASQSNFDIQYTSTGSGTGKSNFAKGVFVYAQTDSKYSSTRCRSAALIWRLRFFARSLTKSSSEGGREMASADAACANGLCNGPLSGQMGGNLSPRPLTRATRCRKPEPIILKPHPAASADTAGAGDPARSAGSVAGDEGRPPAQRRSGVTGFPSPPLRPFRSPPSAAGCSPCCRRSPGPCAGHS